MKLSAKINLIFWRTVFRITPAKWIVGGCNGWLPGWRGKIGEWVTKQYGSADDY